MKREGGRMFYPLFLSLSVSLLGSFSCQGLSCGTLTLEEQIKDAMERSWVTAVARVRQLKNEAPKELPCSLDMDLPLFNDTLQLYQVLDVFKGTLTTQDSIHLVQTHPQVHDLTGIRPTDNFLVILQKKIETCCVNFTASEAAVEKTLSDQHFQCEESAPLAFVNLNSSVPLSPIYAVPNCYAIPLWSYLSDEALDILGGNQAGTTPDPTMPPESSSKNERFCGDVSGYARRFLVFGMFIWLFW